MEAMAERVTTGRRIVFAPKVKIQEDVKKKSTSYAGLTENTVETFKRRFAQKCLTEGTDTLIVTYDELCDITGISIATIYKCIDKLSDEGWLVRTPATSRRYPNTYKLVGTVETQEIKPHLFKTGREFVNGFEALIAKNQKKEEEISDLLTKIEELNSMLAEAEALLDPRCVVAKTKIPGTNLIQVTLNPSLRGSGEPLELFDV